MIDVSSAYRKQPQGPGQGAALRVALVIMLPAMMLTGCGQAVNGAIDLYHGLEGGHIAQQRPPPPGVDDPYPKIGTTPARPLATDIAAQQRIADSLAAQRDSATTAAAENPVSALPAPPALPKPTPPDPNSNKVVVDAAPSPPPPVGPTTSAAPIPAPAAATAPDSQPVAGIGSVPALPAAIPEAALPALADAPPPVPTGLEIAMPMPPSDAPVIAKPAVSPTNGISVAFTPGSSTLPPSTTLIIRRFVLAHRGARFAVTGHGDVAARDAAAQSRALDLGLRRAGAIAASLGSAGIAAGDLHIAADAKPGASTAILN